MTRPKDHSARRRILSNVFSKSLRDSSHVRDVTREILVERMIRQAEIPHASSVVRDVRPVHEAFDMDFLTAFAFTPKFSTIFLNDKNKFIQFCSWLKDFRVGSPDAAKIAKCKLENWCLEMCRAYRAANLAPTHRRVSHCTADALYSAGLQEEEVAAELLDHFITAKKNLAVVHTYSVYILSIYTDIQERLRSELKPFSLDTLSIDDLDSLPFFNAVVCELMRTHTEVKALTPRLIPDGGYWIPRHITGQSIFLPAGTVVSSTREALHLNEEIFPQSLCFWPERWLDNKEFVDPRLSGRIQPQEMRNHLWYFGSGTHGCVAREYALYG
ncbi:cytochrome P450 [Penicillium nucicola]|uniref:cytochrome P450 n=1 Tax=Penicillium nucicola TaxID=1850975 RepID=UPI002544E9C6|nr:cytochrome P450 [Penicillium nucicola]KAJ5775782.1 cytochrome P450 [Penicillium nucicola]